MNNIKNDAYYLNKIKNDILKIEEYTQGMNQEQFLANETIIDSVLFRLIQINETIKNVSLEFKAKHLDIKWNEISGFRNRIVHDYGSVDYDIVWIVITDHLQKLKLAIELS